MNDNTYWHKAKDYQSPLAAEVADLTSIRSDLEFVVLATRLALLMPEKGAPADAADHGPTDADDAVIRRSLWSAAVVAYARCFGTGVRQTRLSEDSFSFLGAKHAEALVAHRYIMDVRNKHVAHSVNAFERAKVVLMIGDGVHSDKGVLGGGSALMRSVESENNVQNLNKLASLLLRQKQGDLKERIEKMLAEASALDEQALNALSDSAFSIPVPPEAASKARTRSS